MGPAAVLSKFVDLKERRKLLDVAGGSGAFSITLCRRYPQLTSTIMDFPAVEAVARRFVGEAKLEDRIGFVAGNALETEWPAGQDVVLISYLLSAVSGVAIPVLLARAFNALAPGGLLIVHDFMVDDDGTGPTSAALWLLCGLLVDPDVELLKPHSISRYVAEAGFAEVQGREVIPTITRMIAAAKPA
jgi:ubiquinone/menaquinone biosynthesis C-methylase UbiE